MSEPAAAPSVRYAEGVARGDWNDDPAQHAALRELDRLHAALSAAPPRKRLLDTLFGKPVAPSPNGLYLWGGVGRGKTFLIDLFHAGLPIREKRRTHFHRFMREVHERLRAHAGERDPMAAIAREWRASLRVLVLDEFFVSDIGDAMLLGRLLERLFEEGTILVTSSNAAPSELYKDGLQRARTGMRRPSMTMPASTCASSPPSACQRSDNQSSDCASSGARYTGERVSARSR